MIENMTGSEVFFNELRGDGNFAKHRLKEKMENQNRKNLYLLKSDIQKHRHGHDFR